VKFEAAAVTADNFNDLSYFFVDVAPGVRVTADRYTKRVHRG
jgi:hypothetical protein